MNVCHVILICKILEDDICIIKEIKEKCSFYLEEKWKPSITKFHNCATFLFPPCRKLNVLPVSDREDIKNNICEMYIKLSDPRNIDANTDTITPVTFYHSSSNGINRY